MLYDYVIPYRSLYGYMNIRCYFHILDYISIIYRYSLFVAIPKYMTVDHVFQVAGIAEYLLSIKLTQHCINGYLVWLDCLYHQLFTK